MSIWVEWFLDNWPLVAVLAIVGGSVIFFFWYLTGQMQPPLYP